MGTQKREGVVRRIGSYPAASNGSVNSPHTVNAFVVLLEGETTPVNIGWTNNATENLLDVISVTQPGDRVRFTVEGRSCVEFVNLTIQQPTAK
jgi:hypothetical protein